MIKDEILKELDGIKNKTMLDFRLQVLNDQGNIDVLPLNIAIISVLISVGATIYGSNDGTHSDDDIRQAIFMLMIFFNVALCVMVAHFVRKGRRRIWIWNAITEKEPNKHWHDIIKIDKIHDALSYENSNRNSKCGEDEMNSKNSKSDEKGTLLIGLDEFVNDAPKLLWGLIVISFTLKLYNVSIVDVIWSCNSLTIIICFIAIFICRWVKRCMNR